jgi:hypothetical protein
MIRGHIPSQDLETFQRWAIAVDDQLREAVDAVLALENPEARRELSDHAKMLSSDRSSADLAAEVIERAQALKEDPDRPAWFTPGFHMVLWVGSWAEWLVGYVEDVTQHGAQPNDKQVSLIIEKIQPAIEHFDRFLNAVKAAGYLSTSAGR